MYYVILCDDPGVECSLARVPADALLIARDYANEGHSNVRIRTPDGETLPLRQFEILLRQEQLAA